MRRIRSREERAAAVALGSVRYVMTALIALVVLSVGIRLYLARDQARSAADAPATSTLRAAPTVAERVDVERRLARIEVGLEVFRQRHGGYPAGLDALVQDGLIAPSELRLHAYEESFYYRGTPDTYTLYAPVY